MKKFIVKTLRTMSEVGDFITEWTIHTGGGLATAALVYVTFLKNVPKKVAIPIAVSISMLSEFGWFKVSDTLLNKKRDCSLEELLNLLELKFEEK